MFSHMVNRRQSIASILAAAGVSILPIEAWTADDGGLSHNAEAIHQEPVFKAGANRIYDALLDEQQFQKIELLGSEVQQSDLRAKPAQISREPGGPFSLFAGLITGRQLELLPNQRIVQSWREEGWPAGIHSIVRFEIVGQNGGSKILFDHTGFPAGAGAHLAPGWKKNYWDTMNVYLS